MWFCKRSCLRRSTNDEDGGSFKAKSALAIEAGTGDALLGPDGVGYVWTDDGQNDYEEEEDDDDDDDDEDEEGGGDRALALALDPLRASCMGCTEDEARRSLMWCKMPLPVEEEDDEDDFDGHGDGAMGFDYDDDDGGGGGGGPGPASGLKSNRRTSSRASVVGGGSGGGGGGAAAFVEVVGDMVTTGHAEGHPPDNLLMEIKGYKFAQNKVCVSMVWRGVACGASIRCA
jgi:hypothetical protein